MKFCPECGSKWTGTNFCAECGKDLRKYINGDSETKQATDVSENAAFSADFDFLSELDNLADAGNQALTKTDSSNIANALEQFEVEKLPNGKYKIVEWKEKDKYRNSYDDDSSEKYSASLSVIIPDCVQIIGEDAFDNTYITQVILPEGLTEIQNYAFSNCDQLNTINFPSSLRKIGEGAFMGCFSLNTTVPKDVEIHEKAFMSSPTFVSQFKGDAELGSPYAQYMLGRYFDETDEDYCGLVGETDRNQAEYWYKKASDAGFADASTAYGELCEYYEDYDTAKIYYKKAILQGDSFAKELLESLVKEQGD